MGVDLCFDVLGEIFKEVCETTDPKGEQHTILHFSSVCSTWRKAALSYPKLWSNIYIRLFSDFRPADPQEKLLAMYIKQSRTAPLSITICSYSVITRHKFPFTPSMCTLLYDSAHRWRKLDIVDSGDISRHLGPFLSLTPGGMGMLQSLKLYSEVIPIDRLLGFCGKAQNLHTLHFNMDSWVKEPVYGGPPCSSIRDIILEPDPSDTLFKYSFNLPIYGLACVKPFTKLERLVIVPSVSNHVHDTIRIASLTSLTLYIYPTSQKSFGTYLRALHLPSIRSLVLIGVGAWPVVEHQSIALFTLRSRLSLRDLIIDEIPLRSQGLMEILHPLRELQHLTVREPMIPLLRAYYPLSQQLMQKLLNDSTFLPKLASVDIHLHAQSAVERSLVDDVRNVIERRALHVLDVCEASSVRRKVTPCFELEVARK